MRIISTSGRNVKQITKRLTLTSIPLLFRITFNVVYLNDSYSAPQIAVNYKNKFTFDDTYNNMSHRVFSKMPFKIFHDDQYFDIICSSFLSRQTNVITASPKRVLFRFKRINDLNNYIRSRIFEI